MSAASQRAKDCLVGTAPPIPELDGSSSSRADQRRLQILLRAQDELHSASATVHEAMASSSSPSSPPAPASTAALRDRLSRWRSQCEQAVAEENEAHNLTMQQLRNGASQLTADLRGEFSSSHVLYIALHILCRPVCCIGCRTVICACPFRVTGTGLKRAAEAQGSEQELLAAKRSREAAHPTLRLQLASPSLTTRPQTSTPQEPLGGLVTL